MKPAELLLFPTTEVQAPLTQNILCIALPTWPTDRVRRRERSSSTAPMAIVSQVGNRRTIVAACATARAAGVCAGMTLVEANLHCPGVMAVPHEPLRDATALSALARWMALRFTPIVAVEPPDALFLEIGGCERLFGGVDAIVTRVRESLRAFGIAARLAVARTPGAAWAFAMYGQQAIASSNFLSKEEREPQTLAELSPAALRIAPEIVQTLARLGVVTIRQLIDLPRDALPSRFGNRLLLRIDQALGRVPEPLASVECRAAIRVSREWEGAVESQEALASVLDELLDEMISALARRGQGARRIEVTFRCPYAPPIHKTVALGRPSRETTNLRRLMRCTLESLEADEGFNAITLRVAAAESIAAARQASLVDVERESAAGEVEGLLERLKIRLGDAALERALLVESHSPERAVRYVAADEIVPGRSVKKGDETLHASLAPRPLELLTHPIEVAVTVTPSNDREGKPIAFSHQGRVHRLRGVLGPERVAGVWWTGRDKTRDYFDVQDEAGRRFWIFRVLETWRWYLHGVF